MQEYLTPEELDYLAKVPTSLETDILGAAHLKRHSAEIKFLRTLDEKRSKRYLEAKRKIQLLITEDRRYPEYMLDLSGCGLRQLPPEIHHLPRRAKAFYLDVSDNCFDSYFVIRSAITRQRSNHPIPFDAINMEGNSLRDIPSEVVERGKFSTEHIEKYWMKHWAKAYTLATRIRDVVNEHRFSEPEVLRLMQLLKESFASKDILEASFATASRPVSSPPSPLEASVAN
jgi:hypothetical protein